MNMRLIALILLAVVLFWKFVLFPSKLELTDRARVLHSISLAKPYKQAVADYWQEKKEFPEHSDIDFQAIKKEKMPEKTLVQSIELSKDNPGVIDIYFTNRHAPEFPGNIEGKKVSLKPAIVDGLLKWSCRGDLEEKFLPKPCR